MKPVVEIDERSGFCFGVTAAIRKAEEELEASGSLYCLGDIVHNSDEVERLRSRGLVTITHEEMARLHGVKVLLRAHGEPPSTYALAKANGIEIIDATCPVVLKLQQRIKAAFDQKPHPQLVIYGKIGHAEVEGLVGQTEGEALVVESEEQLGKVDFGRDIAFYSQTTKPLEGFTAMTKAIEERRDKNRKFEYFDTICRQVANRAEHLREFASSHDVVLFVAGAKSSNGKILYGHCREVNPSTYLVSNESQIDSRWLQGANSIGICGATSTPRWLMEQVKAKVTDLIADQ